MYRSLQRLLLLAFALAMLVSMPLFRAYGFGTNKNKVRVAPLPYFLLGLEQLDFVKKKKWLRGMVDDVGTWLHVPGMVLDDVGFPEFLEGQLKYKSIWKSKHKKTDSKMKSKKRRKKEQKQEKLDQEKRMKQTFVQRARGWRDGLEETKTMAKGDPVGVACGGCLILLSLLAPFVPAAAQFVLLSLIGMNVGVSRQGLPGSGLIDTFYFLAGLLVAVLTLEYFVPDPVAIRRKEALEAKKKELRKAKRKKEKAKAKAKAAEEKSK